MKVLFLLLALVTITHASKWRLYPFSEVDVDGVVTSGFATQTYLPTARVIAKGRTVQVTGKQDGHTVLRIAKNMTLTDLVLTMSVVKMVQDVLIAFYVDIGVFDWQKPISTYLPDYGTDGLGNGKIVDFQSMRGGNVVMGDELQLEDTLYSTAGPDFVKYTKSLKASRLYTYNYTGNSTWPPTADGFKQGVNLAYTPTVFGGQNDLLIKKATGKSLKQHMESGFWNIYFNSVLNNINDVLAFGVRPFELYFGLTNNQVQQKRRYRPIQTWHNPNGAYDPDDIPYLLAIQNDLEAAGIDPLLNVPYAKCLHTIQCKSQLYVSRYYNLLGLLEAGVMDINMPGGVAFATADSLAAVFELITHKGKVPGSLRMIKESTIDYCSRYNSNGTEFDMTLLRYGRAFSNCLGMKKPLNADYHIPFGNNAVFMDGAYNSVAVSDFNTTTTLVILTPDQVDKLTPGHIFSPFVEDIMVSFYATAKTQ